MRSIQTFTLLASLLTLPLLLQPAHGADDKLAPSPHLSGVAPAQPAAIPAPPSPKQARTPQHNTVPDQTPSHQPRHYLAVYYRRDPNEPWRYLGTYKSSRDVKAFAQALQAVGSDIFYRKMTY